MLIPEHSNIMVLCYHCNRRGHPARKCPRKAKTCDTCGSCYHLRANCPEKIKNKKCHNCNQPGHISADCPEKNIHPEPPVDPGAGSSGVEAEGDILDSLRPYLEAGDKIGMQDEATRIMYRVLEGRDLRQTPAPRESGSSRGERKCHLCDQYGHLARNCPAKNASIDHRLDGPSPNDHHKFEDTTDWFFVLDVSGSMETTDPLPPVSRQARRAVRRR